MINFIKGKLELFTQTYVIIENNGIGYKIFVTEQTINLIKNKDEVKIYIYMHVKEDSINLYGVLSIEELNIFEKLISVSGVSAKTSIALLNVLSPQELSKAIITSDINAISKAQGIGKKVAQRIILELKDKVDVILHDGSVLQNTNSSSSQEKEDAIEALVSLGFSKSEALTTVMQLDCEDKSEEIVKKALKVLYKKEGGLN